LWAVQDHYMTALTTAEKLSLMLPFLVRAGLVADPPPTAAVETVRRVIEAAGDRLKVAGDILGYADFFLVEEPALDESAVRQRLAKPGVGTLLAAFAAELATVEPFTPAGLEEALKRTVEAAGAKVGDLVHAVRVAVTGKTVGPGLYDCLAILGRDASLARIARALPRCG
jgi:glutamyl-tRNA synthetase